MTPRGPGATGGDDWVERVRAATDIAELIGQTVTLRRVGRNFIGLCPFHSEKTPSFSVNAERQFYHCFGCKAGGDVFKFVQETEKVEFLEAVEMLSRRAGIPVPERRGEGASSGARTRVLEALEAAATAYEQWLADPSAGAQVRAYLERRGIARDTIRAFRLGLAPAGWENLTQRLSGRIGADALRDAGLAIAREGNRTGLYDRFRNRLMIPLVAGGQVVGFGARALADEDPPKYLNSPETPVYHKSRFLFALDQARRHVPAGGEVVVVEGYFDAIALHQAGLQGTVATSGTALTADQARLLKRLAARVALTYDGDDAGQEATLRSLGVLLGEGLDVAVTDLPRGTDPDALVRAGGVAAWEELRARASDPVAFIQRHVIRQGGPGDPRERALQAVVALGLEVRDPTRLRLFLERAEQVFGIEIRVLERAIALKRRGAVSDAPMRAVVREAGEREQYLERKLLALLLRHPEGLGRAAGRVSPDDFQDTRAAAVGRWVWGGATPEPDPDAAGLVRELLTREEPGEDWESEMDTVLRFMLERRLRRQKREYDEAIRRAPDSAEALHLLSEINDIARSLRDLSVQET